MMMMQMIITMIQDNQDNTRLLLIIIIFMMYRISGLASSMPLSVASSIHTFIGDAIYDNCTCRNALSQCAGIARKIGCI